MNIAQWITAHAKHTPDKTAIHFEGEDISYAALALRIGQTAALLKQRWQISAGDRVAILCANHAEEIVVLFACAQLGAILVPLNWRLAVPELQHIVNDCAPRVLLHDQHYAKRAAELASTAVSDCDLLSIDDASCLALARESLPAAALSRPQLYADNDILIVYTSGTTGSPKGAVLTQRALRCNAQMAQHAYDMHSSDVILNFLPLFHVGGMNIQLTPALSLGATVVLQSKFDPDLALDAIEKHGVTLTNSVPTILQALVSHPRWNTIDRHKLRTISIGSTDVPTELIKHVIASGVPVIQIYGATETAPIAMYQRAELATETLGSIGFEGSCCTVRLVNDIGQDVAVGEHGEIWVTGDNLLDRYWKNPEATALALVDGWFRTGDVARRDERGLHWFSDRIKHVVISGGENIYPAEIERVLRAQPEIKEVAVVGHPDSRWGEVPVAVVVAAPGESLSEQSVLACLNGNLARFKLPRHVVFVDALPRNVMAKVVLNDVRELVKNALAG